MRSKIFFKPSYAKASEARRVFTTELDEVSERAQKEKRK
jgi:hypothetical protein